MTLLARLKSGRRKEKLNGAAATSAYSCCSSLTDHSPFDVVGVVGVVVDRRFSSLSLVVWSMRPTGDAVPGADVFAPLVTTLERLLLTKEEDDLAAALADDDGRSGDFDGVVDVVLLALIDADVIERDDVFLTGEGPVVGDLLRHGGLVSLVGETGGELRPAALPFV